MSLDVLWMFHFCVSVCFQRDTTQKPFILEKNVLIRVEVWPIGRAKKLQRNFFFACNFQPAAAKNEYIIENPGIFEKAIGTLPHRAFNESTPVYSKRHLMKVVTSNRMKRTYKSKAESKRNG
jgi:hypothetical protein